MEIRISYYEHDWKKRDKYYIITNVLFLYVLYYIIPYVIL